MNEKLIQRAAIKYQQWMVAESHRPCCISKNTIDNHLATVSLQVSQMQTWSERFFRGQYPRVTHGLLGPEVYKNIATNMIPALGIDAVNGINLAIKTLKKIIKNTISPITLRGAIEEITIVTKAWQRVKFKDNTLAVLISDVTLSDENQEVNLGSFWIHLNLTNPNEELRTYSVDEVMSEDGNYCHPHITNGELCEGDGKYLMQEALSQGRLEDYFRIVEAILRTYNYKSPYAKLEEWYNPSHESEFYCEQCDEWRLEEDGCWCEGCQTQHCESCAAGGCCIDCGEWNCDECGKYCSDCGERVCHDCVSDCEDCGNHLCSSCLVGCSNCANYYCKHCIVSCDDCGDNICKECRIECDECRKTLCPECVQKCCDECGRELCDNCIKQDCGCLLTKMDK